MTPHISHLTPEALLGRNDSKNPATTCRGITSSGRPCRRALASPKSSPSSRRGSSLSTYHGERDAQSPDSAYCWQHKDQGQQTAQGQQQDDRPRMEPLRERVSNEAMFLRERTSIDTFVQRLGINTATTEEHRKNRRRAGESQTKPSRPERRAQTQNPQTQHTYVGETSYSEKDDYRPPRRKTTPKPKQKSQGFWASLCCMANDDDDYIEIVRHRKRIEQTSKPTVADYPRPVQTSPQTPPTATRPPRAPSAQNATVALPTRPSPQHRSPSNPQTGHLLSLIPPHLSPQTTSLLLTELTKPLSPTDEEGYIYIFWLTPQSLSAPPASTARSLLSVPESPDPHVRRPSDQPRRLSDVMSEFSAAGSEPETRGKRTIMLKIGRANNVTRRMHEWQRQCGYALTLVRWYPYVSSTPSPGASPRRATGTEVKGRGAKERVEYPDLSEALPSMRPALTPERRRESGGVVRKVPGVKRVERLVHLELAERQVKRRCEVCGREHREWFEVEATQAGVRAVDECVRRWVAWAEERAGG